LKVKIPYASWYGDYEIPLDFPDEWRIIIAQPKDAAPLRDEEIKMAFENPIGTQRISELAKGKKDVVLMIVDDISRPTSASKLMPYILDDLETGGIDEENIRIIMATATHRPQTRDDLIKK